MALLELTDISKSFGGVQALRNVDFTLNAGEIHGLAGENGAGKSTMMKIIAGVHSADSGTMRVDGKEVHFRSTRDALAGQHRHGASGAQRRAGTERRRECLFRQSAGERNGRRRVAADGRARGRRAQEPRARHQPARAARRFPDRRAAAGRAVARPVLRRAHHHSRRADFGFVAPRDRTPVRRPLEAARRRPKHGLHLAFPRRHSQDLERDHHLPQRAQGRDGSRSRPRSTRPGSSSA